METEASCAGFGATSLNPSKGSSLSIQLLRDFWPPELGTQRWLDVMLASSTLLGVLLSTEAIVFYQANLMCCFAQMDL